MTPALLDVEEFKRTNASICRALDELSVLMRDAADSGAVLNQELIDAMRYERRLYLALRPLRRQRFPKRNLAKRREDAWRMVGRPGPGLRPRPHTVERYRP